MNVALDECILALSQIKSSEVLRNMKLVVQPDLNSNEQAVISSGKQQNRMVAFRLDGKMIKLLPNPDIVVGIGGYIPKA